MAYTKILTTARLILRKPQPSDEAAQFAMHADPEVMRYFSEPPWTDASRATRQIAEDIAAFEKEAFFRFAVELKATGEYLGSCSLFPSTGRTAAPKSATRWAVRTGAVAICTKPCRRCSNSPSSSAT